MSRAVTVKNTYVEDVDYQGALSAITQLSAGKSVMECGYAMEALGRSIGLPHYLLLHIHGTETSSRETRHNLNGPVDADLILRHPQIAGLLERFVPIVVSGADEPLGPEELKVALAVVAPGTTSRCVLMFGRPAPRLEVASATPHLGLASMAASHLLDAMLRIHKARCPLSDRELACLALAGLPTKDAARQLGISPRTVEVYLQRCRMRLGASTTLGAAVEALRQGWLTHDQIPIEASQPEISLLQSKAGPEAQQSVET